MAFGITGYDHVGIRVSNKEVSIAFYESLGFKVTEEFPEESALEMITDEGIGINLIYNANGKEGNLLMDVPEKHPGITHPAFIVKSLDNVIKQLAGLDIAITEGPLDLGRRKICFIRDPDGTVLEFDELLETR